MSTDQQIALVLRKERVLVRAGQQREQLAQYGEWLKKPCAVADKMISAGRYAKAHPWTVGAATGAVALLGRRHLFRVAGYAWSGWRAWRFVSAWAHESGLINRFKNK
jgi:hypothetical protein